MQLSEDFEHLLARHNAFMNLAKFLDQNGESYVNFLKNVFLFEKNMIQGKDPAQAQCGIISHILNHESKLKKVLFSSEWQNALEYFVLENDTSELLEVIYQLEIGNKECSNKAIQLRKQVIHSRFFSDQKNDFVFKELSIDFVFEDHTPWSLKEILWEVVEDRGMSRVKGTMIIHLEKPRIQGPELFLHTFALYGSEKQAAAIIAIKALQTNDRYLHNMALDIFQEIDAEPEKIGLYLNDAPVSLRKQFERWLELDIIEREFSKKGLSFITEAYIYFEKKSSEGYEFLRKRCSDLGLYISDIDKPNGYSFSNEIPEGSIIRSKPSVKFHSPRTKILEILFHGECSFSAGPIPDFLQEVDKLRKTEAIQPRHEDFEIVKNLLLYIRLGDKVPKPPLLPVYNALRRWFEALSEREEYGDLERLCVYATVFRPHIEIPCIGERLTGSRHKEQKLIQKYAPKYKPGTIIGIRQASISIPSETIPLFLPGVYTVASHESYIDELSKTKEKKGKDLVKEPGPDNILKLLEFILQDVPGLEDELWEKVISAIKDNNSNKDNSTIIFLEEKNKLECLSGT